ncbi:unnamed protein product [Auanema sp. JU1783]|nr:unnamed protein product [Auanema sp. JU1783]
MANRIKGNVLITGANRGVGLELTKSLLENPLVRKVYAGCRNGDQTSSLTSLEDPYKKLTVLELDITKDWAIRSAIENITNDSGNLNVLINNAAILEQDGKSGIGKGDRVAWLKHFDVNVVSHAMVIQESLPLLKKSLEMHELSTIVNISGLKGSIGNGTNTDLVHGNYAYGCSKAALNKLTKTLSIEYPLIMTVSICPGWNKTSMGGPQALSDPQTTAPIILETVNGMSIENSGGFWDRKGRPIPF